MKRRIILCLLCVFAITLLSSCFDSGEQTNVYDTLNTLSKNAPASLTVETTTTVGEKVLRGSYEIRKGADGAADVTYSYERFATFPIGEGAIGVPDSEKETVSGSLSVLDGKIVKEDGEGTELSPDLLTGTGYRFSKSYFDAATDSGSKFSAKVIDPNGFTGQTVNTTDMTVSVTYSQSAIKILTVAYTENGVRRVVTYKFS